MRPHSGIVTRPDFCGNSALGVQTACPPGVCKVPTYIDGMCHGHWHWHCFKNSEPVCEDRTRVGHPPPPQFPHLPTVPVEFIQELVENLKKPQQNILGKTSLHIFQSKSLLYIINICNPLSS
jgi:hypothetical protein